jgi:Spy/CpxP family protein refolding chaperone
MRFTRWLGVVVIAGIALEMAPRADAAAARQHSHPPSGPAKSTARGTRQPSVWKWWADAGVRQQLQLTDEQAAQINALFDRRTVEMTPFVDLLRREQEQLESMSRERTAAPATYAAQVSHVLGLQSRLMESRIVMLYEMSLVLRPEQYTTLEKLLQQNAASKADRTPDARGR